MKIKISKDRITALLLAACAFIYLQPFFCWDFDAKFPISAASIVAILFIVITGSVYSKKIRLKLPVLSIIVLMIIAIMVALDRTGSSLIIVGRFVPYLAIIFFFMLPEDIIVKAFKYFATLLAIFLIPAIIVWLFHMVGVDLPHSVISSYNQSKINNGYIYNQYIGSVFLVQSYGGSYFRFCGMLDEPGNIGTICGLLLAARCIDKNKDWRNIVFLVSGVLSQSMAFIIIVLLYFILVSFKVKNTKAIITLSIIMIAYIVFLSVNFSNPTLAALQKRFTFIDGKLIGDNRSSASLDAAIDSLFSSASVFWGNGTGSNVIANLEGYSYKLLIYSYGIIGFAIIIFWIIYSYIKYATKCNKTSGSELILLGLFVLSIYQRPYVFDIGHILLLFGGKIYINNKMYLKNHVEEIQKNASC